VPGAGLIRDLLDLRALRLRQAVDLLEEIPELLLEIVLANTALPVVWFSLGRTPNGFRGRAWPG
jgi:hypothetical protein